MNRARQAEAAAYRGFGGVLAAEEIAEGADAARAAARFRLRLEHQVIEGDLVSLHFLDGDLHDAPPVSTISGLVGAGIVAEGLDSVGNH
jgi:hypothetical protein